MMTWNFFRPVNTNSEPMGHLESLDDLSSLKVNNKQGYSRLLDHPVIIQLCTHDDGL